MDCELFCRMALCRLLWRLEPGFEGRDSLAVPHLYYSANYARLNYHGMSWDVFKISLLVYT